MHRASELSIILRGIAEIFASSLYAVRQLLHCWTSPDSLSIGGQGKPAPNARRGPIDRVSATSTTFPTPMACEPFRGVLPLACHRACRGRNPAPMAIEHLLPGISRPIGVVETTRMNVYPVPASSMRHRPNQASVSTQRLDDLTKIVKYYYFLSWLSQEELLIWNFEIADMPRYKRLIR